MVRVLNVVKRDGKHEEMQFDKVTQRIRVHAGDLDVNVTVIAQKVCNMIYNGISTSQIDEILATVCASMSSVHPDYGILAGRIVIDDHRKKTAGDLQTIVNVLHAHTPPLVSDEYAELVKKHASVYEKMIDYERDFLIDYFGMKTLQKSYLLHTNEASERAQHMWMRVAIQLHGDDFERVAETYDMMSQLQATHATPTLFNAGTPVPQLSSCFDRDTLVYTTTRGAVPIQDVKIGDRVITHTGQVQPVIQTHINKLGKRQMYEVYVHHTEPIRVTGDHKLYAYDPKKDEFQWKRVDELNTDTYLASAQFSKLQTSVTTWNLMRLDVWHALRTYIQDEFEEETYMNQVRQHDMNVHSSSIANKLSRYIVWCNRTQVGIFKSFMGMYAKRLAICNRHVKITHEFRELIALFLGHCSVVIKYDKIPMSIEFKGNAYQQGRFLKCVQMCFNVNPSVLKVSETCIRLKEPIVAMSLQYWLRNADVFAGMYSLDVEVFVRTLLLGTKVEKTGNQSVLILENHLALAIHALLRAHGRDSDVQGTDVKSILIIYDTSEEKVNETLRTAQLTAAVSLSLSERTANRICTTTCNTVCYRVKGIVPVTNTREDQEVYTLGVHHDHSYNVGGFVAENCFLTDMDDSVKGMYKTVGDCAEISKWSGGLGVNISKIRSKGSVINKTGGKSDGILPLLRVLNATARHINQGGKRLGSFAVYIEPWHPDIVEFLNAKKPHGIDEERARDLFYALWIPDLFMKRVENDEIWSLMTPHSCPLLTETYGEAFEKAYVQYENLGMYKAQLRARDLWNKIIASQIETGTPYMLYKDAVNSKNNQSNVGLIKQSNLCSEITLYTDEENIAVCNLASVGLPVFVRERGEVDEGPCDKKEFDFKALEKTTRVLTRNLDIVIDKNAYPVPETATSNMACRPIGIGVQGLADVFMMMGIAFDSDEARDLNRAIFEHMYYAAVVESCKLAREKGAYPFFKGSPMSQGLLHFDLWNAKPMYIPEEQWTALKRDVQTYGLRNSMLMALMPTASTSQILGNHECFEPITSNLYVRRTLAGEFTIINEYLVKELLRLGLWDSEMKNAIMYHQGSVQTIPTIPDHVKQIYKTAWEIKQRVLIDLSADRAPFVCQSQSLNLFLEEPRPELITGMHFYAWKKGLKTGMYYLRSRAALTAKPVSISVKEETKLKESTPTANMMCDITCESCSA